MERPGRGERRLLSLLRGHPDEKLLRRMLDETEFLSDYGVRALSQHHGDHPYTFECERPALHGRAISRANPTSGLFGGNSNWRGPIWFPVNYLLIESLQKFHHYYGDDFKVECPTGSGRYLHHRRGRRGTDDRLTRLFLRDDEGGRRSSATIDKLQTDPHFRDHVLFHEYFHGDTGRGLGASHQTGWTGLMAKLLQPKSHAPEGTAEHQDEASHGSPPGVGPLISTQQTSQDTKDIAPCRLRSLGSSLLLFEGSRAGRSKDRHPVSASRHRSPRSPDRRVSEDTAAVVAAGRCGLLAGVWPGGGWRACPCRLSITRIERRRVLDDSRAASQASVDHPGSCSRS